MNTGGSKLQELALAHADEGTLEDIRNSNALSTDVDATEEGYFLSFRLIGSVAALGISLSTSYWGFSPSAAVLTTINADIGPSNNASLFSIIWSICCGIGILLFGRTSDKFGRRWFVIGASTLALLGGIIAATAKTMNTLIGANVLLGLGAGVHTCYGLTVGEVCPNKYKGLGVAFAGLPSILSTGFGAYLGLRLVHYNNWRYIYYIFIPLMAFCVVLQVAFYRPPSFQQLHGGTRTVKQELKRVDYVGIFLVVTGVILFLLGVSWGGQPLPWTSATILSLIITGGCLIIIFIFWEIFGRHPNPLVPMQFFRDIRGFVCLIVICSVAGTSYVALSIIWPSQVLRLYASTTSSWESTAWLSTTIAFAIWSSIILGLPLVAPIKHVRMQLIVLMSILTAFTGAMASCNSSNFSQSAAISFLGAFPAGILELLPVLLVQMDSNDADLGTVFSIVYFMRTAVGAVMTAIYLAILTSTTKVEIMKYVPQAAMQAGLPDSSITDLLNAISAGTAEAMSNVPSITPAIEMAVTAALTDAYTAAYAYVYYAAAAVGAFGLIACICIKDYDKLFTKHIPRQIYKAKEAEKPRNHAEQQNPEAGEDKDRPADIRSSTPDSKGPSTTLVE